MSYHNLGRKYKPSDDIKPPHMLAEDLPVWKRWREKHGREYDYFLYDVRITLMEPPTEASTPGMKRMWEMNYSKRLDAVAVQEDLITIIEVTSRAFLRAIGQIIVYRDVWREIKPMTGKILPVILCTQIDGDILFVADHQGIEVKVA